MKTIINLISKYSIVLILSYLFGQVWFYFKGIILPIDNVDDIDFIQKIPIYSGYFFRIIVAILLLVDLKKYKINYKVIPLIGLFYPLLGILGLLVLYIYREIEEEKTVLNN